MTSVEIPPSTAAAAQHARTDPDHPNGFPMRDTRHAYAIAVQLVVVDDTRVGALTQLLYRLDGEAFEVVELVVDDAVTGIVTR